MRAFLFLVAAFGGLCVGCVNHPFTKGPFGYYNQGFEKGFTLRLLTQGDAPGIPFDMTGDGKPDVWAYEATIANDATKAYDAEREARQDYIAAAREARESIMGLIPLLVAARNEPPNPPAGPSRAEIVAGVAAIISDTTKTPEERLQAIAAMLGGG